MVELRGPLTLWHALVVQWRGESRGHKLCFAVLLIMGIIGFVVAPYHSKARLGFYLLGLGALALTVGGVNSPSRFWMGIALLAWAGLGVTAIGLVGTQWRTDKFPPLQAITAHLPHLPEPVLARFGAAGGIHPNQVAAMLMLFVLPLLGVVLFQSRALPAGFGPPAFLYPLAKLSLAAMLFYESLSLARGPLLALLIGTIVLVYQWRRPVGLLALGALAATLVGAFFLPWFGPLRSLFYSAYLDLDGPGITRPEIWRQGLDALAAAPWTGIGLYHFAEVFKYTAFIPAEGPIGVSHAHNIYLQAALDLGLPGAVCYTLLLADISWNGYRAGQQQEGTVEAGVCFGLAAAILAYALYGMFDAIQLTSRVASLVWLVVGLGAASRRVWLANPLHPESRP